MKTTLDLPDDLMRSIKVKAAREDRRLKDVVAELLQRGLDECDRRARPGHRVEFPLLRGGHPAPPGMELTPERLKEILEEEDLRDYLERQARIAEELA